MLTEPAVTEIRTPVVEIVEVHAPIATLYEVIGSDFNPARTAYKHIQTIPATVWTIEHYLGFDPGGVTIIDDDGYHVDGFGIQYLEPGVSLRLSYDIAFGGVAYIS